MRAVLGVGEALGDFLLGLFQSGVGAHLGAGDAVHGRGLGVGHQAFAFVIHLHTVLHRVGEVFLHIVDDAQALIGINDLFIRQRHVGAGVDGHANEFEQFEEEFEIIDLVAFLFRGFLHAGFQLILIESFLIALHLTHSFLDPAPGRTPRKYR